MTKSNKFIHYQVYLAWLLLALLLVLLQNNATAPADRVRVGAAPALPRQRYGDEAPDNPLAANAVLYWDDTALSAIRDARPGPPVVARALAILHTAMYEAWSQYDATAVGTLLGEKFRQPVAQRTVTNRISAMSYAAYRVLNDLFPNQRIFFERQLTSLGYDPLVTTTQPNQPAGLGNLAAATVLIYRHNDGANQLGDRHPGPYSDYTGYHPVNTPSHVADLTYWQPLSTTNGSFQGGCLSGGIPVTQTYVGPHWGQVIPFALDDGKPITPTSGPATYPSPEFTLQAQEVLSISAHLTDREKAIAEYWADGPASELPPGHWALFAHEVSVRDQHSLDDDTKLFFALTNADLDAGILAWKLKRIYNSVRPITAIRELFRGKTVLAWGGPYSGTQSIAGASWQPYQLPCFVTPAFPEFISGHSTFSAAAAQVLKSFTGSDVFGHSVVILPASSLVEPGTTPSRTLVLSWTTFSVAADQAGLSRRYGGIHFKQGDLVGRALGRQVGARAWQKALTFFDGSAPPVADMTKTISATIAFNDFNKALSLNSLYMPMITVALVKP